MACILSDKIMLKSTKSTKNCNILLQISNFSGSYSYHEHLNSLDNSCTLRRVHGTSTRTRTWRSSTRTRTRWTRAVQGDRGSTIKNDVLRSGCRASRPSSPPSSRCSPTATTSSTRTCTGTRTPPSPSPTRWSCSTWTSTTRWASQPTSGSDNLVALQIPGNDYVGCYW